MRKALLATASLAMLGLSLLAGCSGPERDADRPPTPVVVAPPVEQYAGFAKVPLHFVARDGTYVHATAYLPSEPRPGIEQAQAFGTIVNFSPYYTNLYGVDTDRALWAVEDGVIALNQSRSGLLVAHGFAYVAASVPGTGSSGGCFELGGRHEQTVMAEFIDWVGQRTWSNGNVGMAGGSYDGTTQWMAAIHAPKHLKTIVPHVSITDMYEYEYQDGAPYAWWGPYFMPHYLLLVGFGYDPVFGNPVPGQGLKPELLLEDLCPGVEDQFVKAETTYATGVYDAFWHERDYASEMHRIQASVFLVHGLQDWNVKPLHLDVWDRIGTEKVFWLQQMEHNIPYRDTHRKDFSRHDYNSTLLAWYDHYLNGVDNGIPDALPGAWTQDHTGHWRAEDAWPPTDVQDQVLFLGAGALGDTKPGPGQTLLVTPPSMVDPVLGQSVGLSPRDAPDQAAAKFRTEPLATPLRLSGVPHVELNVSVDRPGYAHLVAELWVEKANGQWEFLDMGGRGLAQRNGRTQDDRPVPMEVMRVPIDLNPTESYVEAGNRLVLVVMGDDPAWFHPNGNMPIFTLEHGSTLTLPVLPADTERGLDSEDIAKTNPYFRADEKQF